MKQKYYTVVEACKILGLKEQVIRNYISLGKIKSEKIYNSVVISEQEIEKQLEERSNTK